MWLLFYLHLDRRTMVGFKSMCYKFGTVSKQSHRSEPDQRSGGDPTGSHPRIHYCMCVLNLRFSIDADLITLRVPFHSHFRLLEVLILLSTSEGTKLYARRRLWWSPRVLLPHPFRQALPTKSSTMHYWQWIHSMISRKPFQAATTISHKYTNITCIAHAMKCQSHEDPWWA